MMEDILDTVRFTGDVLLIDCALSIVREDIFMEDDKVLDKLVDKVLILNLHMKIMMKRRIQ